MASIHELVRAHGAEEASKLVPESDRALVPVAARILGAESNELGFSYSGFCMTALPHSRLPDGSSWRHVIETPKATISLLVEPGPIPYGSKTLTGEVPFGSRARLIMLYLQTRAVQTRSREVEIGRSLRDWMGRLGLADGGATYKGIREQMQRIAGCRMTFGWSRPDGKPLGFAKDNIVTASSLGFLTSDPDQRSLWEDRVQLGESFFNALLAHPVPYWEPAIRELTDNSLALDIYIWLAYRLHYLKKPQSVTWGALHAQFGAAYKDTKHFKPRFISSLKLAMTVYPEAKVDVEKGTVTLHPSKPPGGEITKQHQVLLPTPERPSNALPPIGELF